MCQGGHYFVFAYLELPSNVTEILTIFAFPFHYFTEELGATPIYFLSSLSLKKHHAIILNKKNEVCCLCSS
jgi:hypothetical protein